MTALTVSARELDSRTADHLEITLWWTPAREPSEVYVTVRDQRTSTTTVVNVPRDANAWDVFHHPFAYA